MQPITVAFFGISGSGKGTQGGILEKYLKEKDPAHGVIKLEMGNMLRGFMNSGTPIAMKVSEILRAGGLVPSFMPIHLLTVELNAHFNGSQHAIFDGVSRRPDQSRALDDIMRLFGRTELHAIQINLSKETAKARLISRGRFDDAKEEAIANRFSWYQEHVVPAYKELGTLGWKMHEIDGEPDMETVHKNILSVLGLAG